MYFSQRLYWHVWKDDLQRSFRQKDEVSPSFTYYSLIAPFNDMEGATDGLSILTLHLRFYETNGVSFSERKLQPDMKKIAGMEKRVIQEVLEKTKGMSPDELSEESHDTAWQTDIKRAKNDPSDDYISIVNMAKVEGASNEVVNYIRQRQQLESFCVG